MQGPLSHITNLASRGGGGPTHPEKGATAGSLLGTKHTATSRSMVRRLAAGDDTAFFALSLSIDHFGFLCQKEQLWFSNHPTKDRVEEG